MRAARIVLALALLALAGQAEVRAGDCEPEPASIWAPAGWICPPIYGQGIASMWGGPGAARNDCVYDWSDCQAIAVRSLDTGLVIVTTPVTWCHCWVGVTGPNGETARIVDLDPSMVAALGLDPRLGLWPVEVWAVDPATGLPASAGGSSVGPALPRGSVLADTLPDTAMGRK